MTRHDLIVGVVKGNKVYSKLCSFRQPIYHSKEWPGIKKRWSYNLIDNEIVISIYSDYIFEYEYELIEKHLKDVHEIKI